MKLPLLVYVFAIRRKIRKFFGLAPDAPYVTPPENVLLSPWLGHRHESVHIMPRSRYPLNSTPDALGKWQSESRSTLRRLLGIHDIDYRPEQIARIKQLKINGSINRETIYLRVRPNCDVPVHILCSKEVGDGNPVPVFLYMAGSTSGVHLAWGEARVPIDHQRLSLKCDFGRQAAALGYLAVCIEQVGFGERSENVLHPKSADRTIDIHAHATLLGRCLLGEKVHDVSQVINWLEAQNEFPIDPDRIFLFGHSAGGTAALYSAATDTRIKGVLASGSIGRIRDTIANRHNPSGDGVVPGILKEFETEDIVALIAPRAFVGLSGQHDHIFPFSGVQKVVDSASSAYQGYSAAEKIKAVAAPGPHQYYSQESWDAWFDVIDPESR